MTPFDLSERDGAKYLGGTPMVPSGWWIKGAELSGPWGTKAAAEAAGRGDTREALRIDAVVRRAE